MTRLKGDRWFYHPTQKAYADPAEFKLTYESVYFDSERHRILGWYFPACGEAKGTVLHCHGNGGNITGHFKYVGWMPKRGWNVLCFDYRGFGRSEDVPSRPGCIADTHAALDYLLSRDDIDSQRIMLFGQSLGGAVAVVAAGQRDEFCGVAIEGAFSSYRGAVHYVGKKTWYLWAFANWLPPLLVKPGLDAIDSVARIAPTPTFFITGTNDGVCDPQQLVDLYEAAGEPKSLWMIEDGEHTGALTDTNGEGLDRLDRFFTASSQEVKMLTSSSVASKSTCSTSKMPRRPSRFGTVSLHAIAKGAGKNKSGAIRICRSWTYASVLAPPTLPRSTLRPDVRSISRRSATERRSKDTTAPESTNREKAWYSPRGLAIST